MAYHNKSFIHLKVQMVNWWEGMVDLFHTVIQGGSACVSMSILSMFWKSIKKMIVKAGSFYVLRESIQHQSSHVHYPEVSHMHV